MPDEDARRTPGVDELHARLLAAVKSIETGQNWQDWLDLAGRLHRYSFRNLMLITSQRPDATAVAGYSTWKAAGRQVRRGEKSIKVLAPVSKRVTSNDDDLDAEPDGRSRADRKIVGFRSAAVFDIAQTEGPPLPSRSEPRLLDGDAPAGLWYALVAETSARGYRLLRGDADRLGEANGLTDVERREVWVRDDLTGAQAAKTLAHELGHVLLHADGEAEQCRGVVEVEAESVAFVVMGSHGVRSDDFSFPYVAHWAYPLAAVEHVPITEIVSRTGQRVVEAAQALIDSTQTNHTDDHVIRALADRVSEAAERTASLRSRAEATAPAEVDHRVLLAVVADTQEFFRRRAAGSWVPGYLEGRGLGAAVGSHEIGYAPRGWTTLVDHLRSLGYTDTRIEESGVAGRARTGQLIDRFRDRLTLPLRDHHGMLVGFTARVGPDAPIDAPKYLNSPETAIFHKHEVLYTRAGGWGQIAGGARAVVCEGALDAVAVDLASVASRKRLVGVASCGTAFTDDHGRALAGQLGGATVCLAFDGDDAGVKAVERAWSALAGSGHLAVVAAELPSGEDPASFQQGSPERLVEILVGARGAAWMLADRRTGERPPDDPGRALLAYRNLSDWADRVPRDQRIDFVLHIAGRLGIDPTEAAADLGRRHPQVLAESTGLATVLNCARWAQELGQPTQTDREFRAEPANLPALTRGR
ncbi:DNA primase catalytic core [Friedmanniella endophytica]|uniref:DNA primase catalytic core n=1 Tax=Microlunatus kandeliicorticis TaxID=1759536 RepID=A0A7W3IPH2_9ACTN|nr:toprim domain-containing protein [Microlunatus kandeliicorticis]MBA8792851.1 DNA primase catalytic core [Microlunatus kandeliicorticis]